MDVGETGLGPQFLDSSLSLASLGVILSTLPHLSEPHLFSSNVEQPDSRGPSSSVSYASGMEAVWIPSGGRAGSGSQAAQAQLSAIRTARVEAVGTPAVPPHPLSTRG